MDKNFLECLEHIIEIEKTCYIQEKLIESLDKKISKLGIAKNISVPGKINTYVPPVQYDLVSVEEGLTQATMSVFAFIGGVIGFFVGINTDSILRGIIFGALGGALIGAIYGGICHAKAESSNNKAKRNAEKKWQHLYEKQYNIDEQYYNKEYKKYQALIVFDKNRVVAENNQKRELFYSKEELIKKHEETKKTLTRFYDCADIYETYRNIVAICHIYEYLKSGVCEQLTGRDGAYMVFKYEMYEKLKIEKLDTIASKLDQIHFDNITLNNTMERINSKCTNLIAEIGDLKFAQLEAAERNEALINNLGNRIDSAADRIAYQNSIIAYNQECAASELNQIKWLSIMERR